MNSSRCPVHIRWMIRRDLRAVLGIEAESFECLRQRNCIDTPWAEEDFIRMVAESENRVVGFMVYELHESQIHLLTLAVAVGYRRCGVGTQMIDKLLSKLSIQRRSRIVVETLETNLPAQLFFQTCGFRAERILHGFYRTDETAYQMAFHYYDFKRRGLLCESVNT